ncbi:MAG: DUF1161 domain-containing protein [Pseudomonadota bacterium]|jgi:hypothetical protein|nr:DUF1161 domain-containing protein [Xanthomonadaceae bacterium]MDE2249522.1 DUF1161 domain-containing protein [Xanthomonadaceae bacterium]MDE3210926.1 DUF1161 domain-containing protein [Pseudomonadota bacterium]
MNKRFGVAALLLLALPLLAHASCDSLKSSIDAKLKAKGLEGYTLTVAAAGQAVDKGKEVGQCEGSKKIIYTRGHAAAPAKAAPAPASSSAG